MSEVDHEESPLHACISRRRCVKFDHVNMSLRNSPQQKLSHKKVRVVISPSETVSIQEVEEPMHRLLAVSAMPDPETVFCSPRTTFFRAWSFACHSGDASMAPDYEAALFKALKGDSEDTVLREPLARVLKTFAQLCSVNIVLWEGRDMISSLWPCADAEEVVLLYCIDETFSALAPLDMGERLRIQQHAVDSSPEAFRNCLPRGTSRAPDAWTKKDFEAAKRDDDDSSQAIQKFADIAYPDLEVGCGVFSLLKAIFCIPELRIARLYLVAAVSLALLLGVLTGVSLGFIDADVTGCCSATNSSTTCGWNVSDSLVQNASTRATCVNAFCSPKGLVLSTAIGNAVHGLPWKAIGGTAEMLIGAAALSGLVGFVTALSRIRAAAINSRRVIFSKVLWVFRVIIGLVTVALAIWYEYRIVTQTADPLTMQCDDLDRDARLLCIGVADYCGAVLTVTLAPSSESHVRSIALGSAVMIAALLMCAVSFLPVAPHETELTDLGQTRPDISVFRVNVYCPDGAEEEHVFEVQKDIFLDHFYDDKSTVSSSETSDHGSLDAEADAFAHATNGGAVDPNRLERSPTPSAAAAVDESIPRDRDPSMKQSRSQVEARIRALRLQQTHVVVPVVAATIERVAYRVVHEPRLGAESQAAQQPPLQDLLSRPGLDRIVARVQEREPRQ